MEHCPHCGSGDGYFTKIQVSGPIRTYFKFDGSEAENSEMYDSLKHAGGDIAYCTSCKKKIFRIET